MSTRSSRIVFAALAACVAIAIVLLVLQTRASIAPTSDPRDSGSARVIDRASAPALAAGPSTMMPGSIPRTAQGEIAPGEVPIAPPRFDDERDRERYRVWWIAELVRRAEIYKRLEPRPDYPSEAETRAMAEKLFAAAEPRRADEAVAQARRRAVERRAVLSEFFERYHTTPKTVVSRGGDPQYGAPVPPPVEPPLVTGGTAAAPSTADLPDVPPPSK